MAEENKVSLIERVFFRKRIREREAAKTATVIKETEQKAAADGQRRAQFEMANSLKLTANKRSSYMDSIFKRKDPNELERLYASDPVIFNGTNILSSLVNSGWSVTSKNEKAEKDFTEWLKKQEIDDKIPQIATHLCIHGNAWLENIYNTPKTFLAGVAVLDPKSMDFARDEGSQFLIDGRKKILVDKAGMPVGYVQYQDYITSPFTDRIIKFSTDEVTHIATRKVADSFLGTGLLEAAYDVSLRKINVEHAMAEAIFHIGFPTYVAKVGDAEKKPDVPLAVMDKYSDILAEANNKTDFTIPWWLDISILESKMAPNMNANLDYFVNMQIAAMGVTKAFVMGSGESSNRASLEFLTEIGDRNVMSLQKAISSGINRVSRLWGSLNGIKEDDVPVFKFNALSRWDTKTHLELLYRGIEIGAIIPSPEIQKHISTVLNFPYVEGEEGGIGPMPEDAPPPAAAPAAPPKPGAAPAPKPQTGPAAPAPKDGQRKMARELARKLADAIEGSDG